MSPTLRDTAELSCKPKIPESLVSVLLRFPQPFTMGVALSLRDNYQVLGFDEIEEGRGMRTDDYLGRCLSHDINEVVDQVRMDEVLGFLEACQARRNGSEERNQVCQQ